ncbi:MAG TPA: MFS transporter [Gemmatimonadales bacterium]
MPGARSRIAVIFFTVLIDLIGFGIVLPILPFDAQRFGVEGMGFGALVFIFSGMQFLSTAVLGRLSDRVGRRPILLTTMLLNAAGYLLFAFAASYPALFVARLVSGFASGNISAAQAYMADITSPAERSRGMGMIGAAFGLGFTLGPALGGLAHQWWGDAAPGLVAAGLSLINFVSAYFILPESLRPEHRTVRPIFGLAHLGEALARPRLRPLMVVWAVAPFAFAGYTVALPLFAAARLGWHEKELAWLFTLIGITAATVQGGLFGRLAHRFGERALLVAGTFGMAVAIGVIPLLHTSASLYAWTFVLAVANSAFAPAATGLVSVYADPTEQGSMLGAAQAFGALGRSFGPLAMGSVYDALSPSTAFVVAALGMAGAGLVAGRLEPVSSGPAPREPGHASLP